LTPKQRVTITDIASNSGASRTTVSMVLRDRPGISSETRDRVLAAAQELGYERRPAPSLRQSGVKTVAILFRARMRVDHRSPGLNPFYSWVLTGMEATARAHNMNLIVGTLMVNDSNQIVDAPHSLLSQDLDGVIFIGAFTEDAITTLIGNRPYPVVLVDGPSMPQRFDVIASDNVGGAAVIVRHLIDAGHQRIGLIAPDSGTNPNFEQREQGYRAAVAAAGLTPVVGRLMGERFDDALRQAMEQDPELTALFVVNDAFAVGVMKAAFQAEYDIPNQLSIAGFDDTDHAVNTVPELTTMHVDKAGMGRHAILQLIYRIAWPESAPVLRVLSPKLMSRKSVGPPIAFHQRHALARQRG
jgi:DNA-binding LacI/PurR family transcriptional regulator